MYLCLCLLHSIYFIVKGEYVAHEVDIANSFVDKHQLSALKLQIAQDYNALSIEGAFTEGAFGYEEYESCSGDMTAAYGYALGECSRGSNEASYIYNWCAVSDDESVVHFHVTEFSGPNCTDNEVYNNTFLDYNNCDAVNSRKPFCTSSTQGWKNYDFDQHIEYVTCSLISAKHYAYLNLYV